MIQFDVDGRVFKVEFRHRSKTGKRPELHAKSKVNAVTVCVIVGKNEMGREYAAIGTSICVAPDNWSRRIGREQAFADVIEKYGMLEPVAVGLGEEFARRFPPLSLAIPKAALAAEEKAARIDAGSQKRELRRIARGGAPQPGARA